MFESCETIMDGPVELSRMDDPGAFPDGDCCVAGSHCLQNQGVATSGHPPCVLGMGEVQHLLCAQSLGC